MANNKHFRGRTKNRYPNINLRDVAVFLIISVMQGCLALNMALRDVVGFYPLSHDQSGYLEKVYDLYEKTAKRNLWTIVFKSLWEPSPVGVLIFPETVLSMTLLGSGRLACLAVNFAHLLLAQLCIWISLLYFTRSRPAAWCGVGLFLAASFPFFWAGGLLDFRLDFAAVCLFSVVLSLVVASNYFLDRSILPLLIAAVSALLLTRFITVVYWLGIIGFTLLWLITSIWVGDSRVRFMRRLRNRCRFKNLVKLSLAVCLLVVPVLIHNAKPIYNYYGIGHLVGSEKEIRAREVGITDLQSSILYYPRSLWRDHLGKVPSIAAVAVGVLTIGYLLSHARRKDKRKERNATFVRKQDGIGWIFIGSGFVVPLVVLTTNTAKSPVVGSILVPPLILALVLVLFYWQRRYPLGDWFRVAGGSVIVLGLAVFFSYAARPQGHARQRDYANAIGKLYGEIVRIVDVGKFSQPKIAFLESNDALLVPALNVWVYERDGRFLNAQSTLGGIFSLSPEEIKQGMKSADIIVAPDMVRSVGYPYYDSIRSEWSVVQRYLQTEASLITSVKLREQLVARLFAKDVVVSVEGLSGGWVTSAGISLGISEWTKLEHKTLLVVCSIPAFSGYGAERVVPIARWAGLMGEFGDLQVRTETKGELLEIHVKLPEVVASSSNKVMLRLSPSFIPKEIGLNDDARRLSALFVRAAIVRHE